MSRLHEVPAFTKVSPLFRDAIAVRDANSLLLLIFRKRKRIWQIAPKDVKNFKQNGLRASFAGKQQFVKVAGPLH